VKRMYVRDGLRGRGIADAIIARLTSEALDAGLTVLRSETGTHFIGAAGSNHAQGVALGCRWPFTYHGPQAKEPTTPKIGYPAKFLNGELSVEARTSTRRGHRNSGRSAGRRQT
jgi:hypothetical protein